MSRTEAEEVIAADPPEVAEVPGVVGEGSKKHNPYIGFAAGIASG